MSRQRKHCILRKSCRFQGNKSDIPAHAKWPAQPVAPKDLLRSHASKRRTAALAGAATASGRLRREFGWSMSGPLAHLPVRPVLLVQASSTILQAYARAGLPVGVARAAFEVAARRPGSAATPLRSRGERRGWSRRPEPSRRRHLDERRGDAEGCRLAGGRSRRNPPRASRG